jgi:5-methylcytosine-specific restriction endonuclease McrA
VEVSEKRCLVLNRSWNPVGTVSLQRAIAMLFSTYSDGEPKAKIIDHTSYEVFTWDDWSKIQPSMADEFIRSANIKFRVPEVILLTKYDSVPKLSMHFSRLNIYKRDNYTCMYCGVQPGTEELSIDHIIPRSKGGKSSWENCVLCCIECNRKKANKTLAEAKMKLLRPPKKPHVNVLKRDTLKAVKSWSAFVSSAFWNVELEE